MESWNFLYNNDFGLSRAKSGHKDGDEFDNNTFEFPRAIPLTVLTFKDLAALKEAPDNIPNDY